MAENTENGDRRRGSRCRIAVWGTAAFLWLVPLAATQVTDEVDWGVVDFAVWGAMLAAAAGACDLAMRMTGNAAYRTAAGVAVAAAFILVWMNLAVGLIGSEDNPANLMYGGVLAVGFMGAIVARFKPRGMPRALFATAFAQALVAMIALIAGMGYPASPPLELLGVNALFVALWLVSAWLFRKAARDEI